MNTIFISFILFLNVTLLAILVPGGPIENRDFSHLKGLVFWGFNVFLITLGGATFYSIYALFADLFYAKTIIHFIAIAYAMVYTLDLMGFFPKSPTKMSQTLYLLEIINLCLAVYLFIISFFL